MASTEQKASLLALFLGALGAAAYFFFRKKDEATPAGTITMKIDGKTVPVSATVPTPENVKARAFGPAILLTCKGKPCWTCPIGSHVEYATDGSPWCVLNTPATQQRHTIQIANASVTVPVQLNPLADLWNLFTGQPPQMPPIEKRSS